jgi:hypothetical protein
MYQQIWPHDTASLTPLDMVWIRAHGDASMSEDDRKWIESNRQWKREESARYNAVKAIIALYLSRNQVPTFPDVWAMVENLFQRPDNPHYPAEEFRLDIRTLMEADFDFLMMEWAEDMVADTEEVA